MNESAIEKSKKAAKPVRIVVVPEKILLGNPWISEARKF